ncbi:MAG TPA: hypothetical protein VK436_06595, partial [Methanocella sp.]|nr:hypothetical protein [Methanocella sp.]
FELQKQYRPENVSIYDYETGKPLKYQMKDLESVAAYDVSFDRPYFNGYTFVVEYDNHNHIIDEGGGTYSFGMRPGVDINKVERIYTVILPPQNFTYIGYNTALDRPISVDTVDGSTVIVFHNITSAPADYAWEIKFRAIGIKNELEKANTGPGVSLDGGMTLIVSLVSLAVCIRFKKR